MSNRLVTVAFGLGIIALALAFFVPSLIGAPSGTVDQTAQVAEGDTQDMGDVSVAIDAITGDTATITVTDIDTGETVVVDVNESATATVTLQGDDVEIGNERVVDGNSVVVTTSYSATYGWGDETRTVAEHLDILFVGVALVMVTGLIVKVL